MFLKTSTRKQNGKEYISEYLVESYREKRTKKVKHRNLLCLSKLPPKLKLALKSALNNNTKVEKLRFEDLEIISTKEYGSIKIFSEIFNKSFGKIISKKYRKEIEAITINKIFETKSKNSLKNWLKKVDLNYSITNRNKLYDAMDRLEENQNEIEKKLKRRSKIKKADIVLYDITSTYFEGKGDENICKYGYSRDHRKDRVQVNIGLVTDKTGLPISVEIFEGNISDKQTIIGKTDELKNKFKIENITFIFDRGMKTKVNLEYIKKAGYEYITALSHAQLKKKAEENKNIQLSLFDKKDLSEFTIENQETGEEKKYILCHNPSKAKKDVYDKNKLIEKTEEKLEKIKNLKRTYTNEQIQDKISKQINKYKCEKYIAYEINDGKLEYKRNIEKIDEDNKYNGFYMIESTDINITGKDAEKKYKSLQLVERVFDDIKNHIKIRPVFHYKESRIKGHIFSCFMSYYLLHKFKEKTQELLKDNTLDTLLTELQCIHKTYFKIDKFIFDKISKLNPLQKEIFKKFNIPIK